ncbi:MAG: ATP-binding protein [Cyanomargarita calcarea GSE-NOS-MK-12-04C]|jgi:hypothetical protein|uniref:ATP-binding protein n=1 Tax=Cyanomargarita calcarea GSE-NOS-MK-12-04C TaxID=2839659 RepID=A0A951URL4_9CYAN|nr:ATP-binding protein [Cyanomargarita calcarea GSE-NOS-MK-12-04C]
MNTSQPALMSEFQQVISEKNDNFVGRSFVFTAVNEFLHRQNRGYFTIVGEPGSGKSAILAKYVRENPQVVYYNAQLEGKNRVEEFLKCVCTQLVEWLHNPRTPPQLSPQAGREKDKDFPDNATEGGWFLSLLLQKISDKLQPNQRLIIAIDGLDSIDSKSQPPGTNLFYLPRYLPEGVYFLLTRRPFLREKSGLLIETPSQRLDLAEYPEQNRWDVGVYIERNLTSLTPCGLGEGSNFMYVSQIISAINEGFNTEPLESDRLPPSLEAYYQQHWQKMQRNGLSALKLAVVQTLTQQGKGQVTKSAIAEIIDEDEYEVEEVLENWYEFLHFQQVNGEILYSFYHFSFCNWLGQQVR